MRTLFLTALLTTVLGAGAAFGFADSAAAAPAADDVALAQVAATLDMSANELGAMLEEGDDEGRRRPKLRRAKARLLHSLRKACPCNGPDGEGWGENGHQAFVDCVEAKLGELENLPDELKAKILEKAQRSQVGEEGFECPERPERGERPERPGPGGGNGGGGERP